MGMMKRNMQGRSLLLSVSPACVFIQNDEDVVGWERKTHPIVYLLYTWKWHVEIFFMILTWHTTRVTRTLAIAIVSTDSVRSVEETAGNKHHSKDMYPDVLRAMTVTSSFTLLPFVLVLLMPTVRRASFTIANLQSHLNQAWCMASRLDSHIVHSVYNLRIYLHLKFDWRMKNGWAFMNIIFLCQEETTTLHEHKYSVCMHGDCREGNDDRLNGMQL